MKVIKKQNAKNTIPYMLYKKTKIIFDYDLMMDLAKRQTDEHIHIDICRNSAGALIIGTMDAVSYVAEIDIPPKEYKQVPEAKVANIKNDQQEGSRQEALPLDMDKVTLTLWEI